MYGDWTQEEMDFLNYMNNWEPAFGWGYDPFEEPPLSEWEDNGPQEVPD